MQNLRTNIEVEFAIWSVDKNPTRETKKWLSRLLLPQISQGNSSVRAIICLRFLMLKICSFFQTKSRKQGSAAKQEKGGLEKDINDLIEGSSKETANPSFFAKASDTAKNFFSAKKERGDLPKPCLRS